ncbi:MAG TPA: PaaI family thioesterase, partial [Thermohalobaculum sp.]|nr:PaaI family thioesterase [Thermohalobaculum sp.]
FYVAVLASVGPQAQAVTTNLSINFLRRPRLGDLVGEARIAKLGRRLAAGDVLLRPAEGGEPVAQALVTYALPTA